MANPDHIDLLLQGVDLWNARREDEHFRPDLEDANVYAAFSAAGKLDAEGRIPLEGIDLNDANLCRADLQQANLTSAKLVGSDLRSADFTQANLIGAKVGGSQLEKTILREARLNAARIWRSNAEGADLSRANLSEASLIAVNLAGAEFTRADLTECWLSRCNLDNANLSNTDLTDTFFASSTEMNNTILVRSDPAKAILFENPVIVDQFENIESTIDSVAETIAVVRDIQSRYNNWREPVHFYFRGEPRTDWALSPAMMRKIQRPGVTTPFLVGDPAENLDPSSLHDYAHQLMELERGFNFEGTDDAPRKHEGAMLLDLMSRRPHDFASAQSALGQWGLAQHHGLKTRLLDITRNMLVALYFACETYPRYDGRVHIFVVPTSLIKPYNSDTVSIIANFAKLDMFSQAALLGTGYGSLRTNGPRADDHHIAMRKLYHLIREEKPHFAERIDPRDLFRVLVVEPQKTSERIQAQSAAFLISASHERFERADIQQASPHTPVYAHYQLTIPAGDPKSDIIDDLQVMGITRESLYPGLDSSADAVNNLYRRRQN